MRSRLPSFTTGTSAYQFKRLISPNPDAVEKWRDSLQHPEFRAAMETVWNEVAVEAEQKAAAAGDSK